jgi:hypothetical protein
MVEKYPEIFSHKYLIYEPHAILDDYYDECSKETAQKFGLTAQSLFLVHYNDKTALDLAPMVINIIKNSFGEDNILILFENETRK